jgi:thymidylate synthase
MKDFTVITDAEEKQLIERHRNEKRYEEYKYLHLMQNILDNGVEKSDRTGVGTKSIFGTSLKFDLRKSFPIITTKKVFWKGVVEELLWFIRGETDSKKLEQKGVKIWVGNTSREFLDNKGLDYAEGEIGPGYGFQWRHWNADYESSRYSYKDSPTDYKWRTDKLLFGKGIDQLANVIDKLKKDPSDRRMIVSAWNVEKLHRMALPPCHLLWQVHVENDELHLQWYQRSVDTFLGLPFNISSYALLTCLLANVAGLKPGSVTFAGGDTHLYLNHLDQVKEQLSRVPYAFPTLDIKKKLKTLEDIEQLSLDDIQLVDYQSHQAIKAPMAV